MLCPLLVTAINFFEGDTAIFKGRSPRGKLFPTGVKLHPLGNCTRCAILFCANTYPGRMNRIDNKTTESKDLLIAFLLLMCLAGLEYKSNEFFRRLDNLCDERLLVNDVG